MRRRTASALSLLCEVLTIGLLLLLTYLAVAHSSERVLVTAAALALSLAAAVAILGLTLRRRQKAEDRERQALAIAERRNTELAQARDELELRNAELETHTAALAQTHALLEHVLREVEHEKAHAERLAAINSAVLDAAVDGIAMIDVEGKVVLRNAALRRLIGELGLPPDADIPLHVLPLAEAPEDVDDFVRRIRDEPEAESSVELTIAEPERVLRVHSGPVRAADGSLVGRIFVLRDVTRERAAERARSELVATVAHELRTPLTGILGFAALLGDAEVDAETREAYVATMSGEALRLRALIDDFLDVHRIEQGNFTIALAPVELDELVAEQARFYAAQSAAHTIEVDVEPGLTVLGERDRLAQVLANLLTNAIKYSPAGGAVVVAARRNGASVEVEVRDSGIGIPADQQPRVFEKFFRVDPTDTRRVGGTGLGLTLCRDIVESHGGRIELDSVEGEGSTFRVVLPSAGEQSHRRRRVLVVEDDPATAELLQVYLEEGAYEVDVATTGEEALARADQRPPAMICLDIGLAGRLDGWSVLARLKESERTAEIPVVICTGADAHGRAMELGAAGFLRKPIGQERLLEEVHELVAGERASVLVVDDDEHVRSFLGETLSREGLEVHLAENGNQGLKLARSRRPDLLLLDLLMPDMDGLQVLEQLDVDEELRDIPVVVLTGDELDDTAREHLRERTVSLLEKRSYSASELRRLVEHVLAA